MTDTTATDSPADTTAPSGPPPSAQTQPAVAVEATKDTRTQWVCITPEGPRTQCPSFRSDFHQRSGTYPQGRTVVCPTCQGTTVRQLIPGVDPEAA